MIASLGISANVFAATVIAPPQSVGTYNDFGQQVRLDIKPPTTGASQFKICYAPGYNATSGYKCYTVSGKPNVQKRYVWYVETTFTASSMRWESVNVYSVAKDGTLSTPFKTNVSIIR